MGGMVFGFRDGQPTDAAEELAGQDVKVESFTTTDTPTPIFESDDNGLRGATDEED